MASVVVSNIVLVMAAPAAPSGFTEKALPAAWARRAARTSPVCRDAASVTIRVFAVSKNDPLPSSIFCGAGMIAGTAANPLAAIMVRRLAMMIVFTCLLYTSDAADEEDS